MYKTIPQRLSKHFWGKKKLCKYLLKESDSMRSNGFIFAEQQNKNKLENKTAFGTQVLWKYSSEKGHFQPCS